MGIKSPEDKLMEPFPLILESVKDLSKVQVQSVFKLAHRFKKGDFSSIQTKNIETVVCNSRKFDIPENALILILN